jgi:hypothetical protein
MQAKAINKVIDQIIHKDGTYEIKVHAFTREEMGMYEEGMRRALKEKEANTASILYIDFSEISDLHELDERAMFDMFQFLNFNCLRHEHVRIHWGDCVFNFLSKYSCEKNSTWKLSSLTIKKLLDANCGCLHTA